MSAESCADQAVAGWERGDLRVYCPAYAGLLVTIPPLFGRWTLDVFMKKNRKRLFKAFLEEADGGGGRGRSPFAPRS